MLEIKHELVNLDISEFSYFDQVLLNMKLLPHEVEVNVPKYYRREREEELRERKATMEDILRKLGFFEEGETQVPMTESQAIRLIQIHERARQGRIRAQFMKEIRLLKEKGRGRRDSNSFHVHCTVCAERIITTVFFFNDSFTIA